MGNGQLYRDKKKKKLKEMNRSGSGQSKMIKFDIIESVLGHWPANQSTGTLNSVTYLLEATSSSPSTVPDDIGMCSTLASLHSWFSNVIRTCYAVLGKHCKAS